MTIQTRSARHTRGSALQVLDVSPKAAPKRRKQSQPNLRQRKLTDFKTTKVNLDAPPSPPPTPDLQAKKTRPSRSPTIATTITNSTTTTRIADDSAGASLVKTQPQAIDGPQLTTSQSLPIIPDESAHTMRFIQQAKVPFLNQWLEAQTSTKTLLSPMTPATRIKPQRPHLERRKTRAELSGAKVDWRNTIDAMSNAPKAPVKGTVKKLNSSGLRSPQAQRQRPP